MLATEEEEAIHHGTFLLYCGREGFCYVSRIAAMVVRPTSSIVPKWPDRRPRQGLLDVNCLLMQNLLN
jgi:hypothetical protein